MSEHTTQPDTDLRERVAMAICGAYVGTTWTWQSLADAALWVLQSEVTVASADGFDKGYQAAEADFRTRIAELEHALAEAAKAVDDERAVAAASLDAWRQRENNLHEQVRGLLHELAEVKEQANTDLRAKASPVERDVTDKSPCQCSPECAQDEQRSA